MTDKTLTIKAPAKINLYLEVCGKREDGYHNIRSIMQTVSLFDTVTVEIVNNKSDITVSCNNPAVPNDHRNTAYKAAEYFLDSIGEKCGLNIRIDKKIPTESGLAGGSTDAAAVLRALNSLFENSMSNDEVLNIARMVGADVPFCYVQGCALCEGIGEIMTPIDSRLDCAYVILRSGEGVSTKEAYKSIDSLNKRVPDNLLSKNITAIQSGNVSELTLFNSFETAVLPKHSTASVLKDKLSDLGAIHVLMSGSGPSVYGIFDDEISAKKAIAHFENLDTLCYLCKNI